MYNLSGRAQDSSEERNLELRGSKSASRQRRVAKIGMLQNPSENATLSVFRTGRQTLRPAINQRSAGRFWLTFSTKHVNYANSLRSGDQPRAAARELRCKYMRYVATRPRSACSSRSSQEMQTVFQQEHAAYDRPCAHLQLPRRNGRSPGSPPRHP